MTAPDWRTFPALVTLYADSGFDQIKFDYMWDYALSKYVPPLFPAAVLVQEGTKSFNTSENNPAADGGHGPEPDWYVDVHKAVDLIAGKLAFYRQAARQGFRELAKLVAPHAQPGPDQWVNWSTLILRPSGAISIGVYALHASWWAGVRQYYCDFGGTMAALEESVAILDLRAPRVLISLKAAEDGGSNWNGTSPEPAVIVEDYTVTDQPRPTCPVVLPTGQAILGYKDGNRTMILIEGKPVPVRAWAELLGVVVVWTPPERGGPRVDITLP